MVRSGRQRRATSSAVRSGTHSCTVCQEILTAHARVVWTVGRGRLHEDCLENARLVATEEQLRSARARSLPLLLQRMSVCACGSCLALRLGVSLQDARDLMQRVDGANGLKVVQMPCASCGRHVDTLYSDGKSKSMADTPRSLALGVMDEGLPGSSDGAE